MWKKLFLTFLFCGALFVLLVVAGGYYLISSAEQRIKGEFFDADGVKIHYTREGVGEPVILVHGFAFNADLNWRQPGIHEALLNAGYDVIALDCRGHGLSDKPHDPKAYGAEMPRDVVRLMDHLKIEKAHVVGYSMGGFITLKLIEMHPERLLSAAPCGMVWSKPTQEDIETIEGIATALEERGDFAPLLQRIGLPMPSGGIMARTTRWLAQRSNDTNALAAVMWSFRQFEVAEDSLKANKVPTLTIVGDADPLCEGADTMHETMTNHKLVLVPGGNHITTLRGGEFLPALLPFLKENAQNPQEIKEQIQVEASNILDDAA